MSKITLTLTALAISFMCMAQENESLTQVVDGITYEWDERAQEMNSFEGLTLFCVNEPYRSGIFDLLNEIHHYDSVLYSRLVELSLMNTDKEIKKTLQEIREFEQDYDMQDFVKFLKKECQQRKEIEKNADEMKKDLGSESYDGQIYLIETELNKFIKHITIRVDNIRKHVHHLHID